jgi:chorismate-pyruvate lyase
MSDPRRLSMQGWNGNDPFVAQSSRPPELQPLDLASLTPFYRSLLVIDGTVTQFVAAYTYEPIKVIRVRQERERLAEDHKWLDAPAGADVIARDVVLVGEDSSTLYVYGTSLIVADRLPQGMWHGLEREGASLGRLLKEHNVETYRELLWHGLASPDGLATRFGERPTTDLISRTYRMVSAGRPIMQITELFPFQGTGE